MSKAQSGNQLIGREKTLQVLHKAILSAEVSKGTMVLVAGEAGIGKTSIVHNIEADARSRGWTVMASECFVGRGDDPYLPIVLALQNWLEEKNKLETEKTANNKFEQNPPSLPVGLIGTVSMDAEPGVKATIPELRLERNRMFENVLDLVMEASKKHPVLISIDDLHWAETSALQLLYYIVHSTIKSRVLVLGAYRPEELKDPRAKHPMDEILSQFRQESLATVLELEHFTEKDTARMVASLATSPLPPALVKKIHLETGGNPFFIKEFITEFQGKDPNDAMAMTLPSSVSQLIRHRLESMDKNQQSILHMCAVLGQQFNYDLLQGIAAMDEIDLVNAVDGLIAHKVLLERTKRENITYAFTHSLLREVVYDGLSAAKKRMLHQSVGEVLERHNKGREEQVVYKLSYHFSHTASTSKAFKYKVLAGIVSYKHMAMEEAKKYLEDALELLQRFEPEDDMGTKEVELLDTLGKVHNFQGNPQKALELHSKALNLTSESSKERSQVIRHIAEVHRDLGHWKQAKDTYLTAISISEQLDDAQGLAEAFEGLTWLAVEFGDHEDVLKYGERGLLEARRAQDRYLEGKLLIDIGNEHNVRNENDKALEFYMDALKVLDHNKHLDQLSRVYLNKGDLHMKAGRYDRAKDCFENCLEIARITGDSVNLGFGLLNMGTCQGKMGEREEAMAQFDLADKELNNSGDKFGIVILHIAKGVLERDFKNYEAGAKLLRTAITLCESNDYTLVCAIAIYNYGVLLKRWGRTDEARKMLDRFLEIQQSVDKEVLKGRMDEGTTELFEMLEK